MGGELWSLRRHATEMVSLVLEDSKNSTVSDKDKFCWSRGNVVALTSVTANPWDVIWTLHSWSWNIGRPGEPLVYFQTGWDDLINARNSLLRDVRDKKCTPFSRTEQARSINPRGISLIAIISKVLTSTMLCRPVPIRESRVRERQVGFHQDLNCFNEIFTLPKLLKTRHPNIAVPQSKPFLVWRTLWIQCYSLLFIGGICQRSLWTSYRHHISLTYGCTTVNGKLSNSGLSPSWTRLSKMLESFSNNWREAVWRRLGGRPCPNLQNIHNWHYANSYVYSSIGPLLWDTKLWSAVAIPDRSGAELDISRGATNHC